MKKRHFQFLLLALISSAVSASADIANGGFEAGTYANWASVSGTAFVPGPSDDPYYGLVSWAGTYFAHSAVNSNETQVGVLRSDTFVYPSESFISFFIAGHSTHFTGATNNYVVLKLASDGTVLDKVLAPDRDTMRKAALQSEAAYGEAVYIEVVDDCAQTGWAWIAVDGFQLKPCSPDQNLAFKYWEVPINDDAHSGGNEIHPPLYSVPDFDWNLVESHPAFGSMVEKFDLSEVLRFDNMFVQFKGYIDIATSGSYTFFLNSDDGSMLWIDGVPVVGNDGMKTSPVEASGSTALTAGKHGIEVGYFHNTVSPVLEVNWSGPGFSRQEIPGSVLSATSNALEKTGWNSFLAVIPDDERTFNYCPSLMYDGEEGLYKLWICGSTDLSGDHILYKEAATLDGLKYFETQEVLAPSYNPWKFDRNHSCDPCVYHHTNDVFYMTYSGNTDGAQPGISGRTRIGMAVSYDRGRTWTKMYNGEPILEPDPATYSDGYGVGQSAVARASDDYYYMIYTDSPGAPYPLEIKVIRCDDPAFPTNKHEYVTSLNPVPGASLDLAYDAANALFVVIVNASIGPNDTADPFTRIQFYYFDQNWNYQSRREVVANTGFALGEGAALLMDLDKQPVQLSYDGAPSIIVAASTDEHADNCPAYLFHAPWVEGDAKLVVMPFDVAVSFDNHSFEVGTYTDWTKTGAAWLNAPISPVRHNMPADGDFYADSFFATESATGTLQSDPFTLGKNEQISFYIGGWSRWSGGGFDYNYVTLNRASNGEELDRAWTPNQNDAVVETLSHGLGEEVEVVVKVVDDCAAGAYAWLSVDDFNKVECDSRIGRNSGFEVGNFSDWAVSGSAFGSTPKDTGTQGSAGWSGRYFANSAAGGETATGTLRSANFSFGNGAVIAFRISGWASWGGTGAPVYNYVALKRASDDSEIGRIWAPNSDAAVDGGFVASAASEDVYLEVVDNGTATGYAWMAVDDFKLDGEMQDGGFYFWISGK